MHFWALACISFLTLGLASGNAYSGLLGRVSFDGSGLEVLRSGPGDWNDLALDLEHGHVYVGIMESTTEIRRYDLDGSNNTFIYGAAGFPANSAGGLSTDPSKDWLFWSNSQRAEVWRSMLDGTSAAPIISGVVVDNTAVHSSAGHLYFTDYDGGKIKRSDLDGSNVVDVVSGIPGCCVGGIALDLGRDLLYWSSSEGIARSNLDGSDRSDILFETSLALDIGVDSDTGRVYWADNNFHGILTADFAFQNVEAVRGEIDGVEGLAVDSGAGYLYFTALSVPEPPPLAVMGIALAGIGFAHKRTKA